jgi:hypothetical protein
MKNQALKALPNVLHDQTIPNTLGGISPPMAPARRQLPVSSLAIGAGVLIALAVAALTRAA